MGLEAYDYDKHHYKFIDLINGDLMIMIMGISLPLALHWGDLQAAGFGIRGDQLHERVHKVYLEDGTVGLTVDPGAMDAELAEGAEAVDESISLAEVNRGLAEAAAGYQPGGLFDVRPPSEVFVMAVYERGRWFVSPLYTIFEYVRTLLDLPPGDYEGSTAGLPTGTDSASGVLESVVDQVNGIDFDAEVDSVLAQLRTGVLIPSIDPEDPIQGAVSYTHLRAHETDS